MKLLVIICKSGWNVEFEVRTDFDGGRVAGELGAAVVAVGHVELRVYDCACGGLAGSAREQLERKETRANRCTHTQSQMLCLSWILRS